MHKNFNIQNECLGRIILENYDLIYNLPHLQNFPKVYNDLFSDIINIIILGTESDFDNERFIELKLKLFKCLCLIGNIRRLNEKEEEFFYKCLNSANLINQNEVLKIFLKNTKEKENEQLFEFKYIIKDNNNETNERQFLDLVEYEFEISTSLSSIEGQQNLIFNKILIEFEIIDEDKNKENFIKEYTNEDLKDLSFNSQNSIKLNNKLFIKYKAGQISISKVTFNFCNNPYIEYYIFVKKELKKTVFIQKSNKNVLSIKELYKTKKTGINQLTYFDFSVTKQKETEVSINNFIINFETMSSFIVEEIPNNSMASVLQATNQTPDQNINSSHSKQNSIKIKKKISSHVVNSKTPNSSIADLFNSNITVNQQGTTIINNNVNQLLTTSVQKSLPPPVLYVFDKKENVLKENESTLNLSYDNIEELFEENNVKFPILIKFTHEGNYKIKYNISYEIRHTLLEDSILCQTEGILEFKVIQPFSLTNGIDCSYIQNITTDVNPGCKPQLQYFTGTNIKMNIILLNKLEEDVHIQNLIFKINENKFPEQNNIPYNSCSILEILPFLDENTKNDLLTIKPNCNYSIPYDFNFQNEFSGSIGKLCVKWATKNLLNFKNSINNQNLFNEDEFNFPFINVKQNNFDLQYESKIQNEYICIIVHITNKTKNTKKIILSIENTEPVDFIFACPVKNRYIFKPLENICIKYRLIPKEKGELKFPNIKLEEIDINEDKLIASNYHYPNKKAVI